MFQQVLSILKRLGIALGVIIIVFGLFLLYTTFADYRPAELETIRPEGEAAAGKTGNEVHLVTWNIGYAGLGREMDFFYDGGHDVRPAKMFYDRYVAGIDYQLAQFRDFDFVMLQEVDRHSKRSYFVDQYNAVRYILGEGHTGIWAWNYSVPFVPMPLRAPMGAVNSGITILSRITPLASERHSLGADAGWPAGLFQLDRCFILTRFSTESGRELVLINTHNSAFDDGTRRKAQLDKLKEIMIAEFAKGNYVIAGGDWNLNPPVRFHEENITADWIEYISPPIEPDYFPGDWQWVTDRTVPTNRFLKNNYVKGVTYTTIIDFFVVSPNVEVIEVKTLDLGFENADHNPVTMRVVLGS